VEATAIQALSAMNELCYEPHRQNESRKIKI